MNNEQNLNIAENQQLNISGVSKRICDCCGEEHPIMEDNKDGSFTCLSCLIKIDDGNDIDNCMGCNW
jgi:hypothetical protein